jgi:hypothetical protein
VSLAALDAILSPEWQWRYFSFDGSWGPNEEMASMRNGSGDEYSIVFADAGVYIRGFDHESPLSPWAQPNLQVVSGLVDEVPPTLRHQVHEPAFSLEGIPCITVCLWREHLESSWSYGVPSDPDLRLEDGGASWLFTELNGAPATYTTFAAEYYEIEVDEADVAAVFNRLSIDQRLVQRLNGDADYTVVRDELVSLGLVTD